MDDPGKHYGNDLFRLKDDSILPLEGMMGRVSLWHSLFIKENEMARNCIRIKEEKESRD